MKEDPKPIQTPVRLPYGLKEWIKSRAEQNHRSINGEVVMLLETARREIQEKAA